MPKVTSQDVILSMMALDEPRPPVLYHYTSMEGLLGIAGTGRIRATHIRYLNDASESETMWPLVRKRLEERRDSAESSEDRAYLSNVMASINDPRKHTDYVASFSQEGDDLSQWRAYCPAQAGFSIGFSSDALRSQWVADSDGGEPFFVGGELAKIRYVDEHGVSQIDLAIDHTLQLGVMFHGLKDFSGQAISKEQAARAWFSLTASVYKNSAFRSENEWRMILRKPHKPMPGVRFRPGKSTIVPYIEVELDRDIHFKQSAEYMIRRVVIGPTPNPEQSIEAVKSLFAYKGHPEVLVEKSAIPHRHW